jgi:hypothetical protein
MTSKSLLILVEGDDDKKFFSRVIQPEMKKLYQTVTIDDYKQRSPRRVKEEKIKPFSRAGFDCMFVADADKESSEQIKRASLAKEYGVKEDKIVVVVRAIEGWYLAGLNEERCKKFKVSNKSTDSLSKSHFKHICSQKGMTSYEFKTKILNYFSIPAAKRKNESFNRFAIKYGCGA